MSGKVKKLPGNRTKLQDMKEQCKKPSLGFGITSKIRADLARELQDKRKERRTEEFEEKRETKDHTHSTVSQDGGNKSSDEEEIP